MLPLLSTVQGEQQGSTLLSQHSHKDGRGRRILADHICAEWADKSSTSQSSLVRTERTTHMVVHSRDGGQAPHHSLPKVCCRGRAVAYFMVFARRRASIVKRSIIFHCCPSQPFDPRRWAFVGTLCFGDGLGFGLPWCPGWDLVSSKACEDSQLCHPLRLKLSSQFTFFPPSGV